MSPRAKRGGFDLNVSLFMRAFLLERARLDALQRVLLDLVPTWSTNVRILYDEVKKLWSPPIDLRQAGVLFEALDREARRPPSEFLKQLYRQYGPPKHKRLSTFAFLHGAHKALMLYVSVDEYPFAPVVSEWHWRNSVAISVSSDVVEGRAAGAWARAAVEALIPAIGAEYGYACMEEEYWEKNMSREGGGIRAVGLDISKALPGLYWLNFFGPVYRDLIGRERLVSAPAAAVRELGDAGVLLELYPEPTAWQTAACREAERRVLEHLGPQHFFSRDDPERKTVAPDFGLPPQPS